MSWRLFCDWPRNSESQLWISENNFDGWRTKLYPFNSRPFGSAKTNLEHVYSNELFCVLNQITDYTPAAFSTMACSKMTLNWRIKSIPLICAICVESIYLKNIVTNVINDYFIWRLSKRSPLSVIARQQHWSKQIRTPVMLLHSLLD